MNEAELVQHQARAELGRMMQLTSPRPGPVQEIVVRLKADVAHGKEPIPSGWADWLAIGMVTTGIFCWKLMKEDIF
ncbi:hypothetical protein GUJ93_ZPchr0007g3637 [Zizania palustris]|uniref:Uncharacterized protein n=1 Tax=Zizania palustris TaxID=103762 RepID=A0A8J5SVK2_ZIZPA|nr:hypothetical protein GUJ93_ZPchr0007g3637 [Zizania palustris]